MIDHIGKFWSGWKGEVITASSASFIMFGNEHEQDPFVWISSLLGAETLADKAHDLETVESNFL
jgi:hypothetical protein